MIKYKRKVEGKSLKKVVVHSALKSKQKCALTNFSREIQTPNWNLVLCHLPGSFFNKKSCSKDGIFFKLNEMTVNSFTRNNNSTFYELLSHCKLWKDQVAHLWDAFLFFLCPMSHQTKWGAMYCFTDAHPFLQVKLEDFSSIV